MTLAIGANDIVRRHPPEAYRRNVRAILSRVVAEGVPTQRVFVLPQPDWARSPSAAAMGDPASYEAAIQRYNGILREETQRAGAHWVDLFPLMQEQASRGRGCPDGLHPSAQAYGEWAEALRAAIRPPSR